MYCMYIYTVNNFKKKQVGVFGRWGSNILFVATLNTYAVLELNQSESFLVMLLVWLV